MYSQRTLSMVEEARAIAHRADNDTNVISEPAVTRSVENQIVLTENPTRCIEREIIQEFCSTAGPSKLTESCFQKYISPESPSSSMENVEFQGFIDSDDSIRDKDYEPSSEEISLDENSSERQSTIQIPVIRPNSDDDNSNGPEQKGRPRKGRKRKYKGQDRNKRKILANSNQQYYSAKGKLVKPKEFIDYVCSCAMKCHEKISLDERKEFFEHYWNLSNYNVQTTFISTCVKEEKVKRKVLDAKNPEKRQFSRVYTMNKKIIVCRDMFTNTLRISTKRVNTALKKVRLLSTLDRRGSSGGHNRMSDEQRTAVIDHINKFPRYKSHYCRTRKNNQEYLAVGTTLPLMYKLYKDENADTVSFASYKKIFLTDFNLKVKKPKKDTCNKCDTYDAKIKNVPEGEEKEKLCLEHNLHTTEAEKARNEMNADIRRASLNEGLETLTFDMEKTLPLPRLSTNIIFYKRQLWLYNLGIFAATETKSTFNVWLEGQAGRGAQEVGSCLKMYIARSVPNTVDSLILWSDSCGGQNRNIKMVLLLKCVLEDSPHLENIRLRFLVSGHSFLPNDSDFGDVECALKRQPKLFSPQDYIDVMKACRRKNAIEVVSMKSKDFVSTEKVEKEITNRKKSCDDVKINWLKIKEIRILKEKPFSIFIKSTYDDTENYTEVNIKKGKGRKAQALFSRHLTQLWPNGKPVSAEKLKDIKSYLHLIPLSDHAFYNNLNGDETIEEDIEGYNGPLDFQTEED